MEIITLFPLSRSEILGKPPRFLENALAGKIAKPIEIIIGDDLVDAVPMPAAVRQVVEAFVAEHHVEQAFYKRKQKRADPEALARGRPVAKDDDA